MIDKKYNSIIDETIYRYEIKNGLPVFLIPRRNFNHKYAVLSAKCGSIDIKFKDIESDEINKVPKGIAHFLEHKLFEDKESNVFDQFAAYGSTANAYTGFDKTSYLFSTTGHFIDSLIKLLDFVQKPYFTTKNIEKEKGIIAQEISMYEDDPHWQVFFNLLNGMYIKHPIKYDIAGTQESIKKINKDHLELFYNTFYHPGNMVLFIIGDLDRDRVINNISENQLAKKFPQKRNIERIYPEEPAEINQDKIFSIMEISRPIFSFGYKETNIQCSRRERIKQEIATNMLLEIIIGKASNLYDNLYDRGLVNDKFSFNYSINSGYGFAKISGESVKPEILCLKLQEGFNNCQGEINKENFERIYNKYWGEFIKGFNSFEVIAAEFVSLFFRGINLMDKVDILREINLEYLLFRYNNFIKDKTPVLSIIENS